MPSEAVKGPWELNGKSYLCVDLRARVPGRRSPVQKPRGSQQDPEVRGAEDRPVWVGHSVGGGQEVV